MNKLEITTDKSLLAAAGNSHIRLYEVASGNSQHVADYDSHTGNVTAVRPYSVMFHKHYYHWHDLMSLQKFWRVCTACSHKVCPVVCLDWCSDPSSTPTRGTPRLTVSSSQFTLNAPAAADRAQMHCPHCKSLSAGLHSALARSLISCTKTFKDCSSEGAVAVR